MVPFFVQFKCKLGQSYAVANALAEAEIASEIYSTAGDYDLLVKFYVDNDTDIGHFVNEKVRSFPASRTPTPSSPSRRSARARAAAPPLPAIDFARRGHACGLRERPSCPRHLSLSAG